jgi:hypothetical protein
LEIEKMTELSFLEFVFAYTCPDCGGEWTEHAFIADPDDAEQVTTICPDCLGDEISSHWWEEVEHDERTDFNMS